MPSPISKKILICGGAGFIGSNFIRLLHTKYPDYRIFNLDLLTYSGNRKNCADMETHGDDRYIFIQGDICDQNLLQEIFAQYQFDVVLNFAAESHVDRSLHSSYDFIRANIVGAHTLIEACRKYKTPRFVQISTDEVYGDVPIGVSTEESTLRPSNPYAASKASADLLIKSYIRSHALPALIVRGSNNFGPYQYPEKLVPLTISNLLEKKQIPIHGDGGHIRSWIYVTDFCNAINLVMHKGRNYNIYNASGTQKTNLEMIAAIARCSGFDESWKNFISYTNDRPGADTRYSPDATKITKELGWLPRYTFEEGVRETVDWYMKNQSWWKEIKTMPVFLDHYERQYKAQYY